MRGARHRGDGSESSNGNYEHHASGHALDARCADCSGPPASSCRSGSRRVPVPLLMTGTPTPLARAHHVTCIRPTTTANPPSDPPLPDFRPRACRPGSCPRAQRHVRCRSSVACAWRPRNIRCAFSARCWVSTPGQPCDACPRPSPTAPDRGSGPHAPTALPDGPFTPVGTPVPEVCQCYADAAASAAVPTPLAPPVQFKDQDQRLDKQPGVMRATAHVSSPAGLVRLRMGLPGSPRQISPCCAGRAGISFHGQHSEQRCLQAPTGRHIAQ